MNIISELKMFLKMDDMILKFVMFKELIMLINEEIIQVKNNWRIIIYMIK